MKTLIVSALLLLYAISSYAQPNCNVFKWEGDTVRYEACELYVKAIEYYQGSRESQLMLDSVIKICPSFDEAWRTKSIPYLKRGDFLTWKTLIDKAVELNPREHLRYRGWCRYQFLRDYTGALRDLEMADSLSSNDIGYSVNGDYHLNIAKALCHKGLGQKEKAVQIIEKQLLETSNSPGLYDYLHLAVLQLELGHSEKAISALEKQGKICPRLAENAYYLALAHRRLGNVEQARLHLAQSRELYHSGRHRTDPYDHPMDRIYLVDIEREMAKLR